MPLLASACAPPVGAVRVDGVRSELVVRSEHSVQGQRETVEGVRRILLLDAVGT